MPTSLSDTLRSIDGMNGLSPAEIPSILGELERIRTLLLARMLLPTSGHEARPAATTPDLLTVAEVAKALRFSRGHVYELVRRGSFAAVRHGRSVRISAQSLLEWQRRYRTAT